MDKQQKDSPPKKKLRVQKEKEDSKKNGVEIDSSQPTSTPVSLYKGKRVRVGECFQAIIPQFISAKKIHVHTDDHRATLYWNPTDNHSDDVIEDFLSFANKEFGYCEEQALGLLFYRNYNLEETTRDLANFAPSSEEELTDEDKMLFDVVILNCEENLCHISELLPHQPFSSIIHYYYQWKIQHTKKSRMDHAGGNSTQEKVSGQRQDLPPVPSTSKNGKRRSRDAINRCGNCRVSCEKGTMTHNLCSVCNTFWKKTGTMRTLTKLLKSERGGYKCGWKRKTEAASAPPIGMNLNLDDLKTIATSQSPTENVLLEGLEKQIRNLKCSIQKGKQKVELVRKELPEEGAMSRYRRMME